MRGQGSGAAIPNSKSVERILDFGFWILDFGFWILDFGLGEPERKAEYLSYPVVLILQPLGTHKGHPYRLIV
jgi:hypothetical protein